MYLDKAYIIVKRNVKALLRNKQKYKYTNNMQVMLMRLMSKGEYLIVPKGRKFTGSGKLGLIPLPSEHGQLPYNVQGILTLLDGAHWTIFLSTT